MCAYVMVAGKRGGKFEKVLYDEGGGGGGKKLKMGEGITTYPADNLDSVVAFHYVVIATYPTFP